MKAATQAKRETQWAPNAPPEASLNASELARRKRIVAAAMDLASRRGYEAVQMRDVAARADVALGTLYRYFSSKDQLLAHTWADWSHEIESHMRRHPLRGQTRAEMSAVMARVVDEELRAMPIEDGVGIRDILGQVWYAKPAAMGERSNACRASVREHDDRMPTAARVS